MRAPTRRGSMRWRATPEQLKILEELFKGGMKTPTAQQVQQITAKLKELGSIESKNVFYWFQNHKAREKLKLRKNIHHVQLPLFACGFWPLFPPQVIESQWVLSETQEYGSDHPQWVVTWLPTPNRHNQPLETLQLFPAATKETTTCSTSAEATSASSSPSSLCS